MLSPSQPAGSAPSCSSSIVVKLLIIKEGVSIGSASLACTYLSQSVTAMLQRQEQVASEGAPETGAEPVKPLCGCWKLSLEVLSPMPFCHVAWKERALERTHRILVSSCTRHSRGPETKHLPGGSLERCSFTVPSPLPLPLRRPNSVEQLEL